MGNKINVALEDPSNEAKVKEVFNSLDKNKSGSLQLDEWTKLAEIIFKDPASYGFPPIKEDKKKWIETAFKEADINKDGSISFYEFQQFCKKHKKSKKGESNAALTNNAEKPKSGKMAGGEFDYLLKIILLGNEGVGKSCLLLRFADDTFTSSFISTIGVDFKIRTLDVDGKTVKLQVWDSMGSSRFKIDPRIQSSAIRNAHGILVCYDITNADSYDAVKNYFQDIERYADNPDGIAKVLVGCKSDLSSDRKVNREDAQDFADRADFLFFETSAMYSTNVDETFSTTARTICKLLG